MLVARPRLSILLVLVMVVPIVLSAPAAGQGQADLALSPADITFSVDNPDSGEVMDIKVKVHNQGPSVATNVDVEFFVSGVPLPPSKTIATIAPTSSGTTSHQWVTPLPGTYTITVRVGGDQGDPDSTNNEAQRNITVGTVVPTIIVEAEPSSSTLQSKQNFWVIGKAEMNGEPVDDGDVQVEIVQTGASGRNTTNAEGAFMVQMTAPVDQEHYDVQVTVTQGAVNGQVQFNITVLQADLKVTTFTFNGKPAADVKVKSGEKVTIKVGFQNIGNGTAANFNMTLKIDGALETTKARSNFIAGQTDAFTYTWKAAAGSHNLQVTLDSENEIEEISENNNMEAQSITVKKKDEPGPSFEAALLVLAVIAIFALMRNGNGGRMER